MDDLKKGDLVTWTDWDARLVSHRGIIVKAPGYSRANDRSALVFVFNEGRNIVKNSVWLRKVEVESDQSQ